MECSCKVYVLGRAFVRQVRVEARYKGPLTLIEVDMIIVILALSALLSACTSSRTWVASPMESEINGQKYHYHNLVVLKDKPSLFHVVESRSWMEYCKNKITHPITEEERDYPYRECVRESQYVMNGAPSVHSKP